MPRDGRRRERRVQLVGAFILLAGPGSADDARAEASKGRPPGLQASFDENGLKLATQDQAVTFELGGRFHADVGSGGSRAVLNEFDLARVRRFWIEPKLTFNKDLIAHLQYDPSSASDPVKNLLLSYKGFQSLTLTAGNFKEPFSFEQLLSNNDTMFMERAVSDSFAQSRHTGFAVGAHGRNWTVSGGVFGGNINSGVERGGLAGTARVTYAPVLEENQVFHIGVAGSYRALDRSGPDLSFSASPQSYLFAKSLVDTDTIANARALGRIGLEAAWARGPFRVQAEYITTRVERSAAPEVTFQGGFVQAAWVVNGKSPRYSLDADVATEIGVFKGVEPESGQRVSRGGAGVFELAARYSAIELTDRDIRGGFQHEVTAGLNWYPEPFIRLMANYIHAWVSPTAATVTARPTQADIGQVRLQIAF